MAEWISVYGRQRAELDAAAVRHELDAADLWTEAESLGLSDDAADEAVESAFRHLRVERAGEGETVHVHWKPAGRPLRITSLAGPEAQRQITETLEERLPPATGPGPARVRDHLRRSRHVVNLEMSAADARHLGAALGGLLAFSLAEASDGLVCFFDRDWAAPGDRATTIWAPDA